MTLYNKRHYEHVALVLKDHLFFDRPTNMDDELRERLAVRLAQEFEQDNERFDRKRFLEAAGVNPDATDELDEASDPAPGPFDTDEQRTCQFCGGELTPLGTLGQREWFRCRDCGMDQS